MKNVVGILMACVFVPLSTDYEFLSVAGVAEAAPGSLRGAQERRATHTPWIIMFTQSLLLSIFLTFYQFLLYKVEENIE